MSDRKHTLSALLESNPRLAKMAMDRAGLAEIASMLLQLRSELDLSQKTLAKQAGVPKSTISELENAANNGVTLRTLVKVARGAGASVNIGFDLCTAKPGSVTASLLTHRYRFSENLKCVANVKEREENKEQLAA